MRQDSPDVASIGTPPLPSGIVTFLFTDVEGSTRLFHRLGDRFPDVLEEHRTILRRAFDSFAGVEVKTEGDGFFVVFDDAARAVAACLQAQRGLAGHAWPADCPLRVRMGLHTAEATPTSDRDYIGLAVNQAARIAAAGHGGQVLVSGQTASLVREALPEGASLSDLGRFLLKDFDEPEPIYMLVHPELEDSFPALRASPALSHNLPDVRTTFVGRAGELEEVATLLDDVRLVTLLGAGGSGKTRLAVELAARVAARFPAGIRLCDLSPLSDAALVPRAIAATFGVRDVPSVDPLDSVARALPSGEALLLLDNCEHVLDVAAEATDTLLGLAPSLRVLATSREPLGLPGELEWRLEPLGIPAEDADAAQLLATDSGRLFADRARLAHPRFAVTDANARAVASICRQLEGLPLALELAAARVAVMPPTAISERLADRLQLLGGGSRRGTGRHRTLEATIDWSYRLLDERERALFRTLAVFAGGFTLDAIEAVHAGDGDAMEALAGLVDKSLVIWDADAERYRLLETIRAFARERLDEAGETAGAATRHLAFFAGMIEGLEPALRGPDEITIGELVQTDLDNLRAAIAWAVERGLAEGLRLASALTGYWDYRGAPAEGLSWAQRLVEAVTDADPTLRARTVRMGAVMAWRMGRLDLADRDSKAALELLRDGADERGLLGALITRGGILYSTGREEEARALLLEARDLAQRIGDRPALNTTVSNLGEMARMAGDTAAAEEYAREALAALDETTGGTSRALTLVNLGHAMLANGSEAEAAMERFVEAADLAAGVRSAMILAWSLDGMAKAAADVDPEHSARLMGAAVGLRAANGLELDPHDAEDFQRVRERVESALGAERTRGLMASVGDTTIDDAIALARGISG